MSAGAFRDRKTSISITLSLEGRASRDNEVGRIDRPIVPNCHQGVTTMKKKHFIKLIITLIVIAVLAVLAVVIAVFDILGFMGRFIIPQFFIFGGLGIFFLWYRDIYQRRIETASNYMGQAISQANRYQYQPPPSQPAPQGYGYGYGLLVGGMQMPPRSGGAPYPAQQTLYGQAPPMSQPPSQPPSHPQQPTYRPQYQATNQYAVAQNQNQNHTQNQTPTQNRCPYCGQPNPGTPFCPYCGRPPR